MRCKNCGSTNINIDRQQTSGYSWGKGFLGSLVFGAPGAIAGVGGKTKTTTEYHCLACGAVGDLSWVVMDPDTQSKIDIALTYNDTEKLKSYKRMYRNIEWTPPVAPTPTYSAPITTPSQNTLPNDNATKSNLPPEKFEIHNGILTKYNGTESQVTIPQGIVSIGEGAFSECRNLTSITIPNSVTSIGEKAFFDCEKLPSVAIPDSVTSIGERAFAGCENLTSITIPNSVTSIGAGAFVCCEKWKSVTIPNSVIFIGENAFCGCGFTSFILPKNVTKIENNIISGCGELETITVEEGNPNYRSEGNCLIRIEDNTLMSGCMNSKIPDYIEVIGKEAFYCIPHDENLVIPKNIIRIEERAYYGSSTNSVIIPEKVNYIGTEALTDDVWSFELETVTFADPHGWFLMTDKNDTWTPVDDKILSDPKSAAEFIQSLDLLHSYLCKK